MLVLSRRRDSSIEIGGNITVTVLEIHKGRVKLGILAPNDIAVRRSDGLPNGSRRDARAADGARPLATADSI